jgi:hypothetical protein
MFFFFKDGAVPNKKLTRQVGVEHRLEGGGLGVLRQGVEGLGVLLDHVLRAQRRSCERMSDSIQYDEDDWVCAPKIWASLHEMEFMFFECTWRAQNTCAACA